MKNTNPTQHGNSDLNQITPAGNAVVRHVFKLGLDADLNYLVTAIQCDQDTIALPQKFTRGTPVSTVDPQSRKELARRYRAHQIAHRRFLPD